MIVLGIESSCDETSAAVVKDGDTLLSVVTNSSMDLHAQYGGVVPEIAARSHIECINGVIRQALDEAGCKWDDIDAIAVTYGAGLGGSLLIGVLTARTLAIIHKKLLYAVNHVEGHVYANFLTKVGESRDMRQWSRNDITDASRAQSASASEKRAEVGGLTMSEAILSPEKEQAPSRKSKGNPKIADYKLPNNHPEFPLLALIVSGGHSQLVLFRDHFDYTLLGQTQDDAIGEAFDKVAKIIGLPYPGGPSVGKKALEGNPYAFDLPKAKMTSISPALTKLRAKNAVLTVHGTVASEKRAEVGGLTMSEAILSPEKERAPSKKSEKSVQGYDFSFSGLKTAVLRLAQQLIGEDHSFPSKNLPERLSEAHKADIAASFQRVAIETVVDKTIQAYEEFLPASVVIAGGVAASPELRRQLAERLPIDIAYTDPRLCTDNGAMIATLGCFHMKHNRQTADPYSLEIAPNLSM